MAVKKSTIPQWRTACLLCIAGLFLAGRLMAQDAVVTARNAWVQLPLPSKSETALYMEIENHGPVRRAVVAASSDAAAALEMHEMKMEKTMMRMSSVSEIRITPKGKTSLNSNGLHIMMYGLKTRPAVGDTINVTLKLDDGTTVPVSAIVRK